MVDSTGTRVNFKQITLKETNKQLPIRALQNEQEATLAKCNQLKFLGMLDNFVDIKSVSSPFLIKKNLICQK